MDDPNEIARTIEKKQARRETIAGELQDVEARIEALREDLGQAVAAGGEDAAEIRGEIQAAEIERDGFRSALPVLDRELEALQKRLDEAERAEAAQAAADALEAQDAAVAALETAIREMVETVRPTIEEAEATTSAAIEAERAEESVTGRHGRGNYRAAGAWQAHPGLRHVAAVLEAYRTGGPMPAAGSSRPRRDTGPRDHPIGEGARRLEAGLHDGKEGHRRLAGGQG